MAEVDSSALFQVVMIVSACSKALYPLDSPQEPGLSQWGQVPAGEVVPLPGGGLHSLSTPGQVLSTQGQTQCHASLRINCLAEKP